MDASELTRPDPAATPALGESRSHVLAVLQEAGAPLTAGGVAERVGLHANTARFHLDALVKAGLAVRDVEDREQPGRPRMLYAAAPAGAAAGRRSYRLLAEILTSYLAAETARPAQSAVHAGHAWGRYLADRPPPFRRIDAAAAVRELVRVLDDIGFAPEATGTGTGDDPSAGSGGGAKSQVLLRHCPFREIAEEHREIVCSVHLGLMQGLLAELDAPVKADRLDPFVEPSLCVTHLSPRNHAEPHRA